jgi:protein-S-isoprenylcysteine O-methyltransferase Ste14
LVQSGPYHWIRHPIYASFLLILGSTLLISANALVGLAWIGSVGIDAAVRIRYEETRMSARFGEAYVAYAARTGRLFPRLLKARPPTDAESPPGPS